MNQEGVLKFVESVLEHRRCPTHDSWTLDRPGVFRLHVEYHRLGSLGPTERGLEFLLLRHLDGGMIAIHRSFVLRWKTNGDFFIDRTQCSKEEMLGHLNTLFDDEPGLEREEINDQK
jgi:hypothetical protein